MKAFSWKSVTFPYILRPGVFNARTFSIIRLRTLHQRDMCVPVTTSGDHQPLVISCHRQCLRHVHVINNRRGGFFTVIEKKEKYARRVFKMKSHTFRRLQAQSVFAPRDYRTLLRRFHSEFTLAPRN